MLARGAIVFDKEIITQHSAAPRRASMRARLEDAMHRLWDHDMPCMVDARSPGAGGTIDLKYTYTDYHIIGETYAIGTDRGNQMQYKVRSTRLPIF